MKDCPTLSWQGSAVIVLHSVYLVWTACILSVVEATAVLCPKASFAKKKASSKWSVFGAQHALDNRSMLSGAIMSHINRILGYLDAIVYSSLKWLKILYPSGVFDGIEDR